MIVQIGALPPPVGGVTIHCQRVLEGLSGLGHEVHVINPRRLTASNPGELTAAAGLRLLHQARRDRSPVFFHYSSSSCPRRSLKLWLTSRLIASDRLVLVQHSGSFPQDIRDRGLAALLQRRVVRRSSAMLCFNMGIEESLREVSPRTVAIRASSFIPDALIHEIAAEPAPPRRPVLVTSGYRTSTYRYREVLEVWQLLRNEFPELELHCYCYGETDAEFWEVMSRQLGSHSKIRVFEETEPAAFLRALRDASVYVRNTSHDSYGVAVAESLFLGTPVVATRVCQRPPGASVVELGDLGMLTRTIRRVLVDTPVASADSWGADGIQAYSAALSLFSPEGVAR